MYCMSASGCRPATHICRILEPRQVEVEIENLKELWPGRECVNMSYHVRIWDMGHEICRHYY